MYFDEKNKIDIQSIDFIFNRMIENITNSKNDIFIISEQSRRSFEEMKIELELIKQKLKVVIQNSDNLARQTQLAKQRLVEVSRHFDKYSEQQVREAYETANDLQIRLSLSEAEEKSLREKRDDLERRLKVLYDTIQRADHIVNQVNVVLNYLTSDLKNVGAALEQAKLKHEFGINIIAAQEEERKKLSREIHDGPAQIMANVLMRADLIEKTYRERGIDAAIKEISELKKTVREALSEVRRIIYDLRPMALDDLGIVPTLKKYLSTIMEYNKGVDIHFQSLNNETRLPSNYEVAIFRLVQECVNNSVKHGNPTDIWVKLEWNLNNLNVIVKDNGSGFDLEAKREQSFGIIGMRERVEILKGSMDIKTKIGNGTVVMFKIPYPNNEQKFQL
ncbi:MULTISPECIES: sensor histidine kinase [Ureibacillus]|uniref:Signal transduction histidine-protein kinase/phosphatase DegS n=1 Tax=Ureibacillus thermosphaericus TaxID=51173 RepID=A0A840PWX3_URETH|nr:sensor histidine kinase [Ureibacillus thermosphaericus]MBB5150507.1 two-component system sensor histidine kinase DegS [Ureibacillus thermosphaericus]NKZ33105.1 histidine kinase [Ureibacillus thermosphaericus]